MNNWGYNEWLTFYNQNWKLNIPQILALKKIKLEIGQGLVCNSENEDALLHWKNWYHKRKIYEKLCKLSWIKSIVGASILFIYETEDNELDVMLGTALMMNFISKINEEEQSADIWLMPNQADNGFILHVQITSDIINIDTYPDDEDVRSGATNGKIDKSLRITKKTYINKLGFFPLIQIPNFIRVNPTGQASSTMLNAYPDIYPTMWLINDQQDNLIIKEKTRRFSRARGYVQATTEEIIRWKNGKTSIDKLESDYIVETVQNNYDSKGGSVNVSYTQGTNETPIYNQDSDWILNTVFKAIGMSWSSSDSDNYTNVNQTMKLEKEDIESQAVWQRFLLDYMYRLFDCWWFYHGYMKKDLKTERPYSLRFISAGIIDQMMLVDVHDKRIANGTMSRAMSISLLDGIPMDMAIKEREKIIQEEEEEMQRMSKWTDNEDNENDNDKKITNSFKGEMKFKGQKGAEK